MGIAEIWDIWGHGIVYLFGISIMVAIGVIFADKLPDQNPFILGSFMWPLFIVFLIIFGPPMGIGMLIGMLIKKIKAGK